MLEPKTEIQIFLSYAPEDEAKAIALYQQLHEEGFTPWMDKKNILPGEKRELAIEKAIRECDFFLVCLSSNSVGQRGALQKEIKTALDILKEKLDYDIYLIPVRLEKCEIPDSLRAVEPVNLFESAGPDRLKKAIQVGVVRRRIVIKQPNGDGVKTAPGMTTLKVLLKVSTKEYDTNKQRFLQYALAGFLGISAKDIKIKSIEKRSIEITIELPAESAETLLNAYKHNDPELYYELFPLTLPSDLPATHRLDIPQIKCRMFVAWPSDVEEERNRVEAIIQELQQVFLPRGCRLEMLDWRKSVPPGAGNPEDIILRATEPHSWDVFIGILWSRFGTPLKETNQRTGKAFASGFEAEYQRAHDLWQENGHPHIMLYRCTRSIPHNSDVIQLGHVQNFFQRIEKHYEVLYREFDSSNDFADKLKNDLRVVIEKLMRPELETTLSAFPRSRLFEEVAEGTDFSNRESELAQIQNWLSTDFDASILVHAPCGMGKSRFMERLRQTVQAPLTGSTAPSFNYIELDCHRDENISTSVEALLLMLQQKLPQSRGSSLARSELLQSLRFQTVTLKGQKKRLIILIDRIELMSKECRIFIRQKLLPELQNAVYEPLYYPVVIAFGRVLPKEWRGRDAVRFRAIELSPFSKGVVKDILLRKTEELNLKESLNLSFRDDAYDKWTESILEISHGHPRCIVNLVSWLYEQHFSVRADFDSKETFLSFVMQVIEREILSEDNLAPQEEVDKKIETAKWLRQILPYLCLFRSYSLAELRILVECKVVEHNRIDELENLLRRTFLIDRASSNQASFKPHETIRQLLADTIYYQNPETFRWVHQTAHTFYHNWIIGVAPSAATNLLGEDPRDFEQVHYIVESLYHYRLARRGQVSPDESSALLERYRNSIRNSTRYTKHNLLDRLDELLLE